MFRTGSYRVSSRYRARSDFGDDHQLYAMWGATEVTGYLVHGGGHAWPGREPLGGTEDFGMTTMQFKASDLIWRVLNHHV